MDHEYHYYSHLRSYVKLVKDYLDRINLGIKKYQETKNFKFLYCTGNDHHDRLLAIIIEHEKVIKEFDPKFKGIKD